MPRSRGTTSHHDLPLGSLTQQGLSGRVCCGSCGSPRVMRIAMNLTDGTPVAFTSCQACEERVWETEGVPLPIDEVIDRTRKSR